MEGESEWFQGTILGKVAESSAGMWYSILYDGEDTIVTLDIQEDIEAGDMILL